MVTVCGQLRAGPNLSTIQWPCTLVAQSFLHFQKLLFFSLTSYPAAIAYLNLPNRELSIGVRLMKLYWNRNVNPSGGPCLKTVDRRRFERPNLWVLIPALPKMHISAQLIDSFSLPYGSWRWVEEKLSFPLEAHHKAQSGEKFPFSGKKIKRALIFYL